MIPLTRERDGNVIQASFFGDVPVERVRALMREVRDKLVSGDQGKLRFSSSRWSGVKPQLMRETRDKCAYCESHATAVSFGDVEHYRPKSVYWWLAYVYDNYLASCQICNQAYKSDNFEISGTPMPAPALSGQTTDAEITQMAASAIPDPLIAAQVRDFEVAHRRERPLNINPYIDDPTRYFAWEAIAGTGEVWLINKPRVRYARMVVDACERIYGLNRPELLERRFEKYKIYMGSVLVVQAAGIPAALKTTHEKLIASYQKEESEFSGMIRYFEDQRAAGAELPVPDFD